MGPTGLRVPGMGPTGLRRVPGMGPTDLGRVPEMSPTGLYREGSRDGPHRIRKLEGFQEWAPHTHHPALASVCRQHTLSMAKQIYLQPSYFPNMECTCNLLKYLPFA